MPSWKKVVLHGSSGSLAHLKLENLTSQSVLGTDSQGNVVAGSVSGYSLPTATSSVLGGVKVGNTLTISSQVLNARTYVGATAAVIGGGDGLDGTAGYVPAASASDATLFLRGDGTWQTPTNTITRLRQSGGTLAAGDFTFAGSGATTVSYSGGTFTISSTDTNTTYSVGDGGLTEKNFTTALKNKLDGIAASADNYGGWIISDSVRSETIGSGNTLEVRGSGATSVSYDTTSNTLTISSTDTDTNTTYSAGTGLTLSGTTFSVTANTYAAYSHNHDSVYLKIADTGSIIDYIVASAPGTLDTLNEIAAAIGDDANFSASIASVIAGKANTSHTHAISDITSLQSALDGKSSTSHTHSDATTSVAGFMSAADKTKLDGIAANANNYSLPTATASVLGGIKVGTNLSISSGVLSSTDTVTKVGVPDDVSSGDIEIRGSGATTVTKSGNTITIDSTDNDTDTVTSVGVSGNLSTGNITLVGAGATTITKSGGTITITSSDTDTNTTYSAGTGLTLSGTTFSVTAGTYAAASHTHAISDVTGLQTALDAKQAAGSYLTSESDTLATVTGRGATTGTLITLTKSDVALKAQENGTGTAWRGRIGTFNSSADKSAFLGNYNSRAGVFGHNNALTAWDDLWVNTLGASGQGNLYLSWNTYVKGSSSDTNYAIIHAGNIGDQSVNYASSAGAVAWTNVSGRPTAVSSFTNDAGYLTTYTDTNTVTSVGVSGDLSTGDVELRGSGATTVTKSGGTITISSTDNNTTYSAGTGLTLSGTTFSVTSGTYAAASHTHAISDVTGLQTALDGKQTAGSYAAASHTHGISEITDSTRWWNNFGDNHSTRTSFDASTPSYGFGWRYVQGSGNGPGTGGTQFYSLYVGLGNQYPATGAGSYGMYLAVDRDQTNPYLSIRYNENNSLSSWRKINAGYADSAGAVAWTNVSGRPTNVSSFTNDAGYLTTYTDTNTVTSVGVSGDLSTGNITLVGSGATSISKSSGTITISSTDTNTTYSAGTGLTLSGTTFSVTAGTYAAASHTHDDRYYTESEVDSLLTGKVSTDTVKVLGGGISYDTDRSLKVSNGLAIYGAYSGGANTPFTYDIAAQFAFSSRAFELAADWINSDGAKLKLRTLRDCCQNWSPWVSILTSYDFTDWAQQKENQRLSTSNSVTFTSTTSPTILVNDHSDNTKGYRIHNTSGTSVSAMFTNSSNQLVIAAGAVDQINLNKKVLVNGVALGVNITPSATAGRIDASNDIVAYSSSDRRLKKNITPIEDAVKKVKALTGVEFDWDPEYKAAHGYEGHDTGVIAQQVQEVMPTAVRTNETGYLAVRYEKLIGLLVEANKELAARVEELEKKLG